MLNLKYNHRFIKATFKEYFIDYFKLIVSRGFMFSSSFFFLIKPSLSAFMGLDQIYTCASVSLKICIESRSKKSPVLEICAEFEA